MLSDLSGQSEATADSFVHVTGNKIDSNDDVAKIFLWTSDDELFAKCCMHQCPWFIAGVPVSRRISSRETVCKRRRTSIDEALTVLNVHCH